MLWLLGVYALLLFCLTNKNFRLAVGLFIISLPTYLIRFDIFGLPSTLLEFSFGVLFLSWIIKYARTDLVELKNSFKNDKKFWWCFGLFFVGSILGIWISDEWYKSLGQWRAFFFEPMLFLMMLIAAQKRLKENDLIYFLSLATVSISVVAILQKFFPVFYPPSLWDAETFGRVTSFFTTPNAIGLFVAPVLFLLIAILWKNFNKNGIKKFLGFYVVLALAATAILLSVSQGAWVALAVGGVAFLFLIGYKKFSIGLILLGLVFCLSVPMMRQAVLFQDKAGQNRLELWGYTTKFLTSSPKNFVFGPGVRQWFRKVQKPYYFSEDNNIERLTYPHNIFFNFWSEAGLLGMLAIVGILIFCFYSSIKIYFSDKIIGAGLFSSWIVFFVHGLVDVPYFKNDLAFLFWILVAITIFIKTDFTNKKLIKN